MSLRNVILAMLVISAFVLGVFVGASEYRFILAGIKWTDVASLLITFSGLCLAFWTYYRWLEGKKRNDSYLVAKKYLNIFSETCEYLDEIARRYSSLCPAAGVIAYPKEIYQGKIEAVARARETLYQHKAKLTDTVSELHFWGVSLTDVFNAKHMAFVKELENILVISDALNSQLYWLHLKEQSNIEEVSREKTSFDGKYAKLCDINHFRREKGFEGLFSFKSLRKS